MENSLFDDNLITDPTAQVPEFDLYYMVTEFPLTRFRDDFSIIYQATPKVLDWLETLKLL